MALAGEKLDLKESMGFPGTWGINPIQTSGSHLFPTKLSYQKDTIGQQTSSNWVTVV